MGSVAAEPRELSALPPPPPAEAGRAPELVAAVLTMALAGSAYALVAARTPARPSGLLGHGLGVLGILLMLFAETGYSWRKRTRRSGPGPVRLWLRLHVYAGLVGPFLVVLHSALRFRGLAGVVTLLMLVVVGSGLVGRFVHGQRGPDGGDALRRGSAVWYLLHVPLALAMFALAAVHVVASLYYATLLR